MPRTPDSYDWIFLAENEWGNQIMQEVADDWFARHPGCNFVEVHEHAGWFLVYHRDGEIVGTANDAAILRKDRPRPARFSGIAHRRPVQRPDLKEVTSLSAYELKYRLLEEMATELGVELEELTA